MNKSFNLYVGITLVSILTLMLIISFIYTPFDENMINIENKFQKPSITHLMGTDNFGRDIFSRVLKGGQTAFYVGSMSVLIGLLIGVIIGALSGYMGGIIDEIFMRLIDALMAFPSILLALAFITVFGPSTRNTMIAISIRLIPNFSRITRSEFIKYKDYDFVRAARSIGANKFRVMFIHILPNIISPLIVAVSLGISTAILAESGLSYLGLGVQPPHPSLGRMLKEAQGYISYAPWYTYFPGSIITMIVLGFNLLGDGIKDFKRQES